LILTTNHQSSDNDRSDIQVFHHEFLPKLHRGISQAAFLLRKSTILFNKFSAQVTGRKKKQMNTTTSLDSSTLRRNSLLFWCTLVIPVAIIGIGINFILNPVGASTAYGIPIHDPAAFPFMWVKVRSRGPQSRTAESC
jgi:hypothetical protein